MNFAENFHKLDLNLLVVFETVYETRNISQAAAQLGMTQPTISNALARLRAQLGDPLFSRIDRGVAPTPFSENLIGSVRQALVTLKNGLHLQSNFDIKSSTRQFKLSMHGFPVVTLLPELLREIDSEAPGIGVEILTPEWNKPFETLLRDEVDIALESFPHEDKRILFEPLFNLQIVAIARRGHPLIDGYLSREAYSRLGHVALSSEARRRTQVESALLSVDTRRRIVCTVPNTGELAPMVASTDLVALVPLRYAHVISQYFDLQILQIPFRYPTVKLIMGWRQQQDNDPGLTWLKSKIREAALANNPRFLDAHPEWSEPFM